MLVCVYVLACDLIEACVQHVCLHVTYVIYYSNQVTAIGHSEITEVCICTWDSPYYMQKYVLNNTETVVLRKRLMFRKCHATQL